MPKWWPCPACCQEESSSSSGGGDHPWSCCPDGGWPDCMAVVVEGVTGPEPVGDFDQSCEDCGLLNGVYFLTYQSGWTLCAGLHWSAFSIYKVTFPVICEDDGTFGKANYLGADHALLTIFCFGAFFRARFIIPAHNRVLGVSCGVTQVFESDVVHDGTNCLAVLDGVELLKIFPPGGGPYCDYDAATATLFLCDPGLGCCGSDTPVVLQSTCTATITGTAGCAGNPLHPDDGDHALMYAGTGAYNPCGGSNFGSGPMKWRALSGTYILLAFCREEDILLQFWFYTCNLNGTLGKPIIWIATVPLGSCFFESVVLTLDTDIFGCVDPSSTVTLHDFVL